MLKSLQCLESRWLLFFMTVCLYVCQLRWVSHIMCMPDSCIAKQVFLGQLAVGKRLQCGPVLRYKDARRSTRGSVPWIRQL